MTVCCLSSAIARETRGQPSDPEWVDGVLDNRSQFRSYSAGSPHYFSAIASFAVNGSAWDRSFIEDSDLNRQHHEHQNQQRYLDTSMDESNQLSRAYGLPNIHESPSAATQQQPFGAYDESGVQAVCLPFFL